MLEKLVRSTRSVVGGILLWVLVFVTVFGFISVEALRGNGTSLGPEPLGVGVDMAILQVNPSRAQVWI
jgi:hypothetical protein